MLLTDMETASSSTGAASNSFQQRGNCPQLLLAWWKQLPTAQKFPQQR
jgi:hypothetical protein